MGLLHEQIKHELKLLADARSAMKRSEERLAGLVAELIRQTDDPTPPPAPVEPLSEPQRRHMLKRLRKLGFVPKDERS